ncbi:leucyl aminopeptidase [Thalassobacillus hwangdonensis]|uniref:Probable cytosol aminopeptidase n=1 Tax=Thalassobacillus hwangdonensis TaxID=546108 RepID=A0ABW3L3Y9_9BACI
MFLFRKTLFAEEDALVVGLFQENGQEQSIYQQINQKLDGSLDDYIKDGDLSHGFKQISKVYTLGRAEVKRIYFVGLGKRDKLTSVKMKQAFGKLFKQLQKDGLTQASVAIESFRTAEIHDGELAEVISEAMITASYQFADYKTRPATPAKVVDTLTLVTDSDQEELNASLKKGYSFGIGVNTARHLVQLPANLLTSTDMAEFALSLAKEHGFEAHILDKAEMEQLGMGALLAVNQGSHEPPKMIVLKYQGLDEWKDAVGLVGKGITYDTGGYSIKSKAGMPGMKGDMGGAAAVLGAMDTIGRLKPKKNVLAVIPSSDNMISGAAFKPDDVITSLSGKTIEVLNTDAEGRLALADGITYAKMNQATTLIDVATLTGGVVTALGSWMTGAMTNDESLLSAVIENGKRVGEPIWQLPYNEDYQAQVRASEMADLNNSPTRKAHPIMGGAFVGEFAEDTPWVHLDIAGTSVSEKAHDLGPKGPTGVMSRTLASFILNSNSKKDERNRSSFFH